MVQRLAERMKQNPGDLKGWKMLGWSYSHIERPADAVDAYRHAVDLAPTEPELHAQYAEALVQAAQGKVTDDAHKAITETLAINPNEPRARYLAGLWQEQQGKNQDAFEAWNKLLKSSDINADWVPELKARLEKLAVKLGKDPAPYRTTQPAAALPSFGDASGGMPSPHAPAGPTPDDVAAANAMSPESRNQMVSGMVERLVEKLSQNPKNLDGWLMLARSRMVLGDTNAARTAIDKAREVFAGDAAAQSRISAYMKDIGLNP
jgi:cytochrome c-type biogenesis protein CcmH